MSNVVVMLGRGASKEVDAESLSYAKRLSHVDLAEHLSQLSDRVLDEYLSEILKPSRRMLDRRKIASFFTRGGASLCVFPFSSDPSLSSQPIEQYHIGCMYDGYQWRSSKFGSSHIVSSNNRLRSLNEMLAYVLILESSS